MKNLTRAGKAPVPGSGKPREDPLQQNHMLERRNLWGEQMREKSRPHGTRVLGLGEFPPPGITHTPLWLLWGRGNPSHVTVGEQVPLAALEQPQPLPAPMGALWSGHHGHLCDHLSTEALPGPIPSVRGCPGLVDRAELGLGLYLGTCWAGPLCCSCPGPMFASSGSCTEQPHHRRVPRDLRATATQEPEEPSHPTLVLG